MRRVYLLVFVLLTAAVVTIGPGRADQTNPALDGLFERLQTTADAAEAQAIEGQIWEIWVRRGEEIVDQAMARGIIAMGSGAFDVSLQFFDDVVRLAPDHAEAWNKRATVHYLRGDFNSSVADIQRTLELEPRHFGALSGLGLIYAELGREKAALKAMERALAIHPHLGIKERIEDLRARVEGKGI